MSPTGHITSSAKHGSGEDKTETRLNFEHAACSFGKGRCLAIVRWHSQFMSCRTFIVNTQKKGSAASRPADGTALYCARFLAALASLGQLRHQAPPSLAMPVSALRVTIDVDLKVHSCPPRKKHCHRSVIHARGSWRHDGRHSQLDNQLLSRLLETSDREEEPPSPYFSTPNTAAP